MSTEEKPDTEQPEEITAEEAADESAEEQGEQADEANAEPEETSAEEELEEDIPAVEIPELKQILEGAILAADTPLSIDNMISLFLDAPRRADIRAALAEIEEDCEGRGFELKQVASGYRFQVRSRYGEWVSRLWEEKPPRYSRALLETLALIAYKQPLTRGDIEEIRGVAVSSNIIRTLLEREWVRIVGHRDVPGRPALYATTKNFLDYFNLASLDELPTLSEIRDLDKLNEELNLEEETIEPRTLELEPTEHVEDTLDDTSELDEVTDKVNQIQENIKNLFAEEEPEDDFDDEDEDDRPKLTIVGSPAEEPGPAPESTAASEESASPAEAGNTEGISTPAEEPGPITSSTEEPETTSDTSDTPEGDESTDPEPTPGKPPESGS